MKSKKYCRIIKSIRRSWWPNIGLQSFVSLYFAFCDDEELYIYCWIVVKWNQNEYCTFTSDDDHILMIAIQIYMKLTFQWSFDPVGHPLAFSAVLHVLTINLVRSIGSQSANLLEELLIQNQNSKMLKSSFHISKRCTFSFSDS